jgi:hypothetical protein
MESVMKTKKHAADSPTSGSLCLHKPTTAVVFVTKALDECKAIRLDHLLQTAGPNVDVWLLHNHNIMMANESELEELKTSIEYVRQLEHQHMLYSENQANKTIAKFDTKISGSSKSFLRWVVQHPEYKHSWQIEDDVFFTGEWSYFFLHADNDADYVGPQIQRSSGWNHWGKERCTLARKYVPSEVKKQHKKLNFTSEGRILCRDVLSWTSTWSINRFSTRGAHFLLEDLESGALQGQHEAVMHGFFMGRPNLTLVELPPLEGSNEPGSWGRYLNKSESSLDLYQPVQVNRFYHPLKCEAYAGEKIRLFKEIMMMYGWSNRTLYS